MRFRRGGIIGKETVVNLGERSCKCVVPAPGVCQPVPEVVITLNAAVTQDVVDRLREEFARRRRQNGPGWWM